MVEEIKAKLTREALSFLRAIAIDNDHSMVEVKAIYKQVGAKMYQLHNTDSLKQLLTDLLSDHYSIIGITEDDLHEVLSNVK